MASLTKAFLVGKGGRLLGAHRRRVSFVAGQATGPLWVCIFSPAVRTTDPDQPAVFPPSAV